MPVWLWLVGLLLFVFSMAISSRAMAVNPHFEGTVRIQKDRDHRVIEVGPYSRVRHPGYVGLGLWALASPFLQRLATHCPEDYRALLDRDSRWAYEPQQPPCWR